MLTLSTLLLAAAAQTMSAPPVAAPAPSAYTGDPGDYIAHNFRFGTGETLARAQAPLPHPRQTPPQRLPAMSTTPCCSCTAPAATPTRSSTPSSPASSSAPASRSTSEILPHLPRRHRPRRLLQTLRRPAHEVPSLRLRRHGPLAAPDAARRPPRRPPPPHPRHVHGLHAELRLGRNLPQLYGRTDAAGLQRRAARRPQPHDPLHGHRKPSSMTPPGTTATTPRNRNRASAPPMRCCSSWAPRRFRCRRTTPPARPRKNTWTTIWPAPWPPPMPTT
jgi:hypothetical protein